MAYDSTFETGVAGWTPTNATFVQSSAQHRNGGFSGLLTVVGSPTTAYFRGRKDVVAAPQPFIVSIWAYSVAGFSSVRNSVDWYDIHDVYITTDSTAIIAVSAATWTQLSYSVTCPSNAAYGMFGGTLVGSPATGTAVFFADFSVIPGNAVAYDTFARTSTSGWGTSTSGHAWTQFGGGGTATDATVDVSGSHHKVEFASTFIADWMATVSIADVDMSVTGSVAPSGGAPLGSRAEILGVLWRVADSTHYYMARVNVNTDKTLDLYVYGHVDGLEIGHRTGILDGLLYTSGQALTVRVQSFGSRHRVKVWVTSGGEPTDWTYTCYDGTYLTAGGVGARCGLGAANTNTKPVVSTITEFWAAANTVHGGGAFLANVFGSHSLAYLEIAPGADLTADPSTWDFVDVTADLRHDPGVSVTKGRPDEAAQAQPSKFGCVLGNKSADYTPRRANSTYYPYMRRDLPIRWQIDPGTGISERFAGFVDTNVPSWDVSGEIPICTISASGLLRRLNQGDAPLRSSLYRAIYSSSPTYYWSMEDAGTATSAVELSAGPSLLVKSGEPIFGAPGAYGTAAAVDFTLGGILGANVNVSGSWRVAFAIQLVNLTNPGALALPLELVTTDGTVWQILMTQNFPGANIFSLNAVITSGVPVIDTVSFATDIWDGQFHTIVIEAYQVGAALVVLCYLDGVQLSNVTMFATRTLTNIVAVLVNPTDPTIAVQQSTFSIAHLALWSNIGAYPGGISTPKIPIAGADNGHIGETPAGRLARICAEESIPIAITGTATDAMGPQPLDTLTNILRQCEITDGGVLGDGQNFGLTYVCRSSRYNEPVAIALAIPDGHIADPFAPVDDDQGAMNDVTVTQFTTGQTQGTSARAHDDDDIAAHGRYQSSFTVNTQTTVPLFIKASWAVHIGTVDVERYPSVNLDLAAAPEIASAWLACIEGSRMTIDGLPVEAPDGQVDNLIEGYTEKITVTDWDVTLNCSPALGWTVAVIQDADTPWRVDSDDSTLTSDITPTAASFQVSSVHIWTTTATFPADFPFDIEVGGEQITVTGITGTSSPQTFAVTRSINGVVKNHQATDSVSLWRPAVIAQ